MPTLYAKPPNAPSAKRGKRKTRGISPAALDAAQNARAYSQIGRDRAAGFKRETPVADAPQVAAPEVWSREVEGFAASEVRVAAIGLDYVAQVVRDRVFDLWDAVYIVSGRRYPAGSRLHPDTVAALAKRTFVCSECKKWRATHAAGAFTVTTLYPSVRCMDCRRVAGSNARGGYFANVGSDKAVRRDHRVGTKNRFGQEVDDVMSELVDDPQWGVDETLEQQLKEVRETAKEVGLIVETELPLTKAMKKRRSEVSKLRRVEGASVVKAKKEVRKEARAKFGHDYGRECYCARCVELRQR